MFLIFTRVFKLRRTEYNLFIVATEFVVRYALLAGHLMWQPHCVWPFSQPDSEIVEENL